MSHVYIASISRGDQSSNPFLQASLTDEIREPVTCASRFASVYRWFLFNKARCKELTYLFVQGLVINNHLLYKVRHALYRFCAERPLKGC